ncbi:MULTISPECIES: glycosyltransferase family 2 protein [Chryseobacterium]|uniref:SPBc2 prophage-derived glycosyltransferase SunS n=1 Tax=Chryseobacterium salivictor TaxID=2547600 RepID=A0A4P6ZEY9_9FLAO|nr:MULTISPECIES: glycosyltransferase family 2 protein [Chryseobacterium]MDQ0477909.1 glycosyltransferase involved in cell wall biosynthesis [Chryseobacterium sp. MDT2-18]QBO58176.1 SPBc2 prophage-derived glycosyltransferase SunS [Chryseobacterium salivictor]
MGVSVAVITYNEEENIKRFLDSVNDIADEIIVVDSYSKDKTKERCSEYSQVKFYEKKFNGYGEQKNYALDLCTNEWVLFLDADEIPDEELKKSIRKIVDSGNSKFEVYDIKFNNYLGTHLIEHGGWGRVFRERFFKRNAAKYSPDRIHEYLMTDNDKGSIKGSINHYTYRNIHHYLSKMNNYSDMMAEKMFESGRKVNQLKIIVNPPFQFFKTYFLKLGFLDGFAGFYIARTMAFYNFMKYIKLYSIIKRSKLEKKSAR